MKKLIYIYDAYCPWCYAFTSVVGQLYENYREEFEFEVLSGGMLIDDRVKKMGGMEASKRLRTSYQSITDRTGVGFGEAFFEAVKNKEMVMNSEIPARALAVFRELDTPYSAISFVHQLLKTLFLKGHNPAEEDFYRDLLPHFQLDAEYFIEKMQEEYYQQLARYDFALAKQLQADAFPRLYFQTSDTYFHLIAKGYSDYERIVQIIEKIKVEK